MLYTKLLILFTAAIEFSTEKTLPNYITPCPANNEICLKNTIEALQSYLGQGIKEFQIPSIVPFHIPNFNYSKNIPSYAEYTAAVTNAEFNQINIYKVSKINVDLNHFKFFLALTFPQLELTMPEKATGTAFGLQINWDGVSRMTYKNLTVSFALNGEKVSKGGQDYVSWTKENIDVSGGSINYDIVDLVKDEDQLKVVLEKVDQNREFIDGELKNIVTITLAKYIVQIIKDVHDTFPINVLYAS